MLKFYKLIILILVIFLSTKVSFGQRLILEKAESIVLVQLNNLVKAKKDALKDAKTKVILQAVSRFLNYESMVALEPILEKYFLENPDIFIDSIRVTKEGNTADLSEFYIQIETQIIKSRIFSTFNKLGIPRVNEKKPIREVFLIYNANSEMRQKKASSIFLKNLQFRLIPYRIKIKVVDIKNIFLPIEAGLNARLKLLPDKFLVDSNRNNLALLELKILLSPKTKTSENGNLKVQLIFWSKNQKINSSDETLINVKNIHAFSIWDKKKIIPEILDGLSLKWAPVILKTMALNKENAKNITLKFVGINSPIEEQIIYKVMFQNNPNWKEIYLDKISMNYVTYKGIFLGNKNTIFRNLNISQDFQFRVKNSYWENNNFIITISWKDTYAKLESYDNSLKDSNLIEQHSLDEEKIFPILQVPKSTFKETYLLPFASPVIDNIRHRGDSTLYKIDFSKNKKSNEGKKFLKIIWHRIGPSNLSPKITLLDKKKQRIKSFLLGRKKDFIFKHEFSKNKKTFFLRVSDEIGFLEDVAGSYQSFRYILIVKQI